MNDGQEQDFDIDAGVDSIASDMGWNAEVDDKEEKSDIDLSEGDNENHSQEDKEDDANEKDNSDTVSEKSPPASWSKDQHENWAKVPKEAQEYIKLREKQMLDGIEQYKEGNAYASEIQKIVEPFKDMIDNYGVEAPQAIGNLLSWNKTLTNGPIESRQNAFIKLGQDLGIIPAEGQSQIDPNTQELKQRLDRMERQESQRSESLQKENYNRVAQEVSEFAKDKEDFDLLGDDITLILKSGVDLPTAYEKARWANPITRARAISEIIEQQDKLDRQKKADSAKAAIRAKSTNIRQTNTDKTQSEPKGALFDDMGDMLAEIRRKKG